MRPGLTQLLSPRGHVPRLTPLLCKVTVLTQLPWPQRPGGRLPSRSLRLSGEPRTGRGPGHRRKGLLASPDPDTVFPGMEVPAWRDLRGLTPPGKAAAEGPASQVASGHFPFFWSWVSGHFPRLRVSGTPALPQYRPRHEASFRLCLCCPSRRTSFPDLTAPSPKAPPSVGAQCLSAGCWLSFSFHLAYLV